MNSEIENFSTEKLIELALTESETQAREYITVLHFRANLKVLQAAQKLCQSKNKKERELGADILGQLGIPNRAFPEESLQTLLKLLEQETSTDVICAIGFALGHLQDYRGIKPLVKFKNHPNADVRYSVVFGILCQENELAINTLIELSSDEDEDVRNWATFGLGSQIDTDTPAIREALWQRLINEKTDRDETYEIYGEALVGLARRKDERVIEFLLQELTSNCVGYLALEAAEEIGDFRLYPALVNLREWLNEDKDLLFISMCDRALLASEKI
jgi:HEAT repeat protein